MDYKPLFAWVALSLFSFFHQALLEPVTIPGTVDDMGFVGQPIQQGGGNLITDNISVDTGTWTEKNVGRGNKVVTWTINDGLVAGEEVSLFATVTTGTNPKGKQEFTSCGIKPITGSWSSTAVVAEDGSIINSTPSYTDRLEVEVICPGSITE